MGKKKDKTNDGQFTRQMQYLENWWVAWLILIFMLYLISSDLEKERLLLEKIREKIKLGTEDVDNSLEKCKSQGTSM